jgi:hypothetical protein
MKWTLYESLTMFRHCCDSGGDDERASRWDYKEQHVRSGAKGPMETSSSFNEAFKHAVTPGTERLLAGVALAAAGSSIEGKARLQFPCTLYFAFAVSWGRGKASDMILCVTLAHTTN